MTNLLISVTQELLSKQIIFVKLINTYVRMEFASITEMEVLFVNAQLDFSLTKTC